MKPIIYTQPNPFKKVIYYEQKDNNLCTWFSACGCLTYNTWIEIPQDKILELWADHTISSMSQTAQKIADYTKTTVHEVNISDWLKYGKEWWIQVSLSADPHFYLDGQDGKIDELPKQKLGAWHAMWLYANDRIIVVNSWWKREIDITDFIESMLESGTMKQKGIIMA